MGAKRKRKPKAAAEQPEAAQPSAAAEDAQVLEPEPGRSSEDEELTPYELERQRLIQRNRERLAALGIPTLVAKMEKTAQEAKGRAKKKRPKKGRAKQEAVVAGEGPMRRSSRIKEASMTAEERFEADLAQLEADGECPRCGEAVAKKSQRKHLEACSGPAREEPEEKPKAARRKDVELTEEERKDLRKRTLARMRQLSLENLVDFSDDGAKFVVLGSTGNHYTVTLSDEKHTCECMDYRFRRHHCKHICLALSHLGILDEPTKWHQAVEAKLSELVQLERRAAAHPLAQQPVSKGDEQALRLL